MPSKQACPASGAFAFWRIVSRCEASLEEKNATCCKNLLQEWC